MHRWLMLFVLWGSLTTPLLAVYQPGKPLVSGLNKPTSVVVAPDGQTYVSVMGDEKKKGDGAILVIKDGKATPFVEALDNPRGLVAFQQWLFAVEADRVLRIDRAGKVSEVAGAKAFPGPAKLNLVDLAVDELGTLYVLHGGAGDSTVYRLDRAGKAKVILDEKKFADLNHSASLVADGTSHVLVGSFIGVHRVALADGKVETIKEWTTQDLAWDHFGRLYFGGLTDIFVLPRPDGTPAEHSNGFKAFLGLTYDPFRHRLLVVDAGAGTLHALPANVPGAEVDETPMPLDVEVAFKDLQWSGWKPESDAGKINPLRPIVLTHANDGTNRIYVATQHGVIHRFAGDGSERQTQVILDISAKVRYSDSQNEEGLLGLVLHPQFKKNGEFFVFYTDKKARMDNVLSRFRMSKADPNRADPASEEEIFRISRPFWNHDGGTLCFGPDGYLYFTLGDGGAANDPFDNGQKMASVLGKVLRIDVDRKDGDKPYAIPKDNPFVGQTGVRPEIWAYGFRNIWRMAFDRKTGELWAADVGQNLWEEINIVRKGGNYGWNRREGLHAFGPKGSGPKPEFIEPIWEYHHDIGKSVTGGLVYRGERLPALQGAYVYADYVTNRLWALRYDADKKRVTANRPIKDRGMPVLSFGEDEKGEIYFMTPSATGQGIYRFAASASRGR